MRTGHPALRTPWPGLALAWIATAYLLVLPLFRPRGPYGWGHYRVRDLLLGVCAATVASTWTCVRLAPPRWRRRLALRLATACLATVVAAAGFDVAVSLCRIYGSGASHRWNDRWGVSPDINIVLDPEMGYARRPGIRWHGRINPFVHEIDYHGDEHGFRNPDGIVAAGIAFIGDSFTEANEMPTELTFVERISRRTGLRAVNLGRSGYGPLQEAVVFRKFGLGYRPRYLVWQICEDNDLTDAERFTEWERDPAAFYRRAKPKSFWTRYGEASFLWHLLGETCRQHGTDIRHPNGQIEQLPFVEPYVPDAPARHPIGMAAIERSILDVLALCRRDDVRPLVLFVPLRERVLAPYILFRSARERDRYLPEGRAQDLRDFGSTLARFCKGAGCAFLDLYPWLKARAEQDDRRLYFKGDPHLDTDGHAVVAEAVTRWIQSGGPREYPSVCAPGKGTQGR